MADPDRCPICGAARPADAPEGLCPRCLMRNALGGDAGEPSGEVTAAADAAVHETEAILPAPASGETTAGWTDEPGGATLAFDGSEAAPGLPRGAAVRYFGDYQIKRELGRGGMGVVYEALQVSLNRPVALKMVKAGLLAGDDELRRFQNEAEAVALLDHPGVVPVYEVGEHAGQHYFSMKLVPGGSLVPLLERYKDDPKAAARLLAETAEAVAHAHSRGILHRDLKPANVLVDEEGHPHVTDVGLAKRVEADVEFTASGAILGTPAYMAPEQATGRRGSITTATDVYGLGSVLYALLTGKAPFGGDSVLETLDEVRNTPPEPPTKLNVKVPRDLETICLKCLEKDPRRRYPTAQAVADDLHAWLDSRPISARRVSGAERAWLWCKRKPAIAALAAAVLLAVVGGTAAAIAVQANANRVLRVKNAELTRAYGREAKANANLAAANRRVEQRYALAVDAIKTFHTGVSEDFLLKEAKFKDLRNRLLKSASDFYGKLGDLLGKETDFASRQALAEANSEVADLTAMVGRKEDALAAHRQVLAVREALAAAPGADPGVAVEVGRSLTAVAVLLGSMGKTDEALATYRRSEALLADLAAASPAARAALAACRSQMGWFLTTTKKNEETLAVLRLARSDQEALLEAPGSSKQARRDLAATINRIGGLLSETGKPTEAETHLRKALAIRQTLAEQNPTSSSIRADLAQSRENLGILLSLMGKPAEAEAEYRQALAIRQALADDNPAVTEFRIRVAQSRDNLGILLYFGDKPSEAEAEFRAELAIQQKLVEDNPSVTEFRSNLAGGLDNLGAVLCQAGKLSAAEVEHRKAQAIFQTLVDADPAVTQYRSRMGRSHNNLGSLLSAARRLFDAEVEFRRSWTVYQRLADENPSVTEFRSQMAGNHIDLGALMSETGRPSDAEVELRRALELYEELDHANPDVTYLRGALAQAHHTLGLLHSSTGKPTEAEFEIRKALAIRRTLAEGHPAIGHILRNLASSHNDLGRLLSRSGKPAEAETHIRKALAIRQRMLDDAPNVFDFRDGLANSQTNLSDVLRRLGRPAEACDGAERAVALVESLVREHSEVTSYRSDLALSLRGRAMSRHDLGDHAGAEADTRRALVIWDAFPTRSGSEWFETACSQAVLAGLAGRDGSGVSAAAAASEADAAVALLRKAVALGYRNADHFRTEDALAPLRSRPDFRLLMMDLAMPADPFVR